VKILRRLLIVLAVPAAALLGLKEIGGTPLSKGTDTGFTWHRAAPSGGLTLSNESGNLTCWIELKIPISNTGYTASLSTTGPLRTYTSSIDGTDQWLAIVTPSARPQDMFLWPAGATLLLVSADPANPDVSLHDWHVDLSDKQPDSQSDAARRKKLFIVGLVCLALSVIGGILEVWDKIQTKSTPITAQICIEALIQNVTGADKVETERMRAVLTLVLIKRIKVADALRTIPLTPVERQALWFATRSQFRAMLTALIKDLLDYLGRL
jgi:hypothetical protein